MLSRTMHRGVGHVSTYLETPKNFNSKFCHFMTQPRKSTGIHSVGSRFKSRLAGLLVILNESSVIPLSSSRVARDEFQTVHFTNASDGSANAGLANSQRECFERDNTDHKASVVVAEKQIRSEKYLITPAVRST